VSAIAAVGACKSYGTTPVLSNLDLRVPARSITAVLGPSGSGKTTLLRCIAGFERLDAGSITIGDAVVDDSSTAVHAQHRGIGYVPQEGALFPHLRVHANIGFGLRRSARGRIAELVEMLGLHSLEHRFPHELSGGQRQRVALARALAPQPAVVLLDEPFSSLDATLRASLRREVTQVLRSVGTTAILVTHDREEALATADQIALLRDGRIAAIGSPRDLYAAPADEPTALFLGAANLLTAKVVGGQLHCGIPLFERQVDLADGAYTLMLRPEHLAIATHRTDQGTEAVVVATTYTGPTSEVRLRIQDDPATELVVETSGQDEIEAGQHVWVHATNTGVAWQEPPAGDHRPRTRPG
jgi:iron(III) transport system ATP-binding protein